jgi:hypothetical protein
MCQATTEAFHSVRKERGPGLSRLLYLGIPLSLFERGQRWAAARGKRVWDPTKLYHMRGTPDEEFGILVDNTPVVGRMLAAVKEHASQRHVIFYPDGTDAEWMSMMTSECWVIAWPRRSPHSPMLDDVFADLPQVPAPRSGRLPSAVPASRPVPVDQAAKPLSQFCHASVSLDGSRSSK